MKLLLSLLGTTLPIYLLSGFGWPWSFQYHNNELIITSSSRSLTIESLSYTITESKVTSGQDPEGRVAPGTVIQGEAWEAMDHVHQTRRGYKLVFPVGRHGSREVANWFNHRIRSDQNTFDHSAEKLNFAFLGTLRIKFTGKDAPYEFKNIALAQGHAGLSNNWWFGGKDCDHIEFVNEVNLRRQVICGSSPHQLQFLRGFNGNNRVSFKPQRNLRRRPYAVSLTEAANVAEPASAGESIPTVLHRNDELFLVGGLEEGALGSLYWDDEHGSPSSDPGYLWSRADLDPWHARWDPQRQRWDWIFYLPDSLDPRWFWNFRTGEWEAH